MSPNTKVPWARLYVAAAIWFVFLLGAFLLPVSLGWQKLIGFGVLLTFFTYLVGWLYIHRGELAREDWERFDHNAAQRDVPLRPVQIRYLRAMERHAHRQRKPLPLATHVRHR